MYFAHPIDLFWLTNFGEKKKKKTKQKQTKKKKKKKKKRNYQVWFLFGMIPSVDSFSRHFGTINK